MTKWIPFVELNIYIGVVFWQPTALDFFRNYYMNENMLLECPTDKKILYKFCNLGQALNKTY